MAKAKFVKYIEELGDVYECSAPYGEQLHAFRDEGIKHLVSVRDASFMRLNSDLIDWTRTCHAPICAKKEDYVLTRVSPIATNLRLATKATKSHSNNQWFYQPKSVWEKYYEQAEQDKEKSPEEPEKWRAIIIPRGNFKVTKISDLAKFLWQDTRENYFEQKVGGNSVGLFNFSEEVVDSQEDNTCIVNYLWFDGPEDGSDLSCRFRDLNLNLHDRAFGVLKKTGEASPASRKSTSVQKIKVPYTQKKVKRLIKSTRKLMSQLEENLEFLESLKQ